MRFYLLQNDMGETVSCETSKAKARDWVAQQLRDGAARCSITALEIPINGETVRRLLASEGGYAESTRYYEYLNRRAQKKESPDAHA